VCTSTVTVSVAGITYHYWFSLASYEYVSCLSILICGEHQKWYCVVVKWVKLRLDWISVTELVGPVDMLQKRNALLVCTSIDGNTADSSFEDVTTTDSHFLTNELSLLMEDVTLDTRRKIFFQHSGSPPQFYRHFTAQATWISGTKIVALVVVVQ
jgi:hypothetical protein